jgi:flagellar assembly protein FliH
VTPSISERSHEARHATRRHPAERTAPDAPQRVVRAGTVTAASFRTVKELQAATADEEFLSGVADDLARQGYLDGHEQGAIEGYRTGREQAVQEVAARMGSALGALTAAARQLAAADAVALAELDREIAGFAVDVAGTVIGHELAATTDAGAEAVARAIALAPDRGDIVARLHPADVATLGDVEGLAPGRAVTFVADPSVQPGGCVLDIGACRVDAQLGSALDRVREVLAT